ncbi:AraC family transcriptional regulator [Bacillus niameyensis]|uniref:AraC family transcriptional regulator n=1 Tax=Bacillus niameyensis TaxID=1522308 RepID=UPI0007845EA3|nr:AraC family transcriptional regulator [Bacillus niameyensis]
MNMLEGINGALSYIENNLEYEIDENEIARRACCSIYHFKRMFSSLSGITLAEYIRRRRLTLAGIELKNSNTKVIDLSVKYGYSSADAFSRAFQQFHGMTPTEARKNESSLISFPPMTFRLTIEGGVELNYRIEERSAFQIVGVKKVVHQHNGTVEEGENQEVIKVWESIDDDTYNQLISLSNQKLSGILHVTNGETVPGKQHDYYFSVATDKKYPKHFSSLHVPALTWAIFEVKAPWEPEKWHRIYSEWFPSSGYEETDGPRIQVGPDLPYCLTKPITREHPIELWIPVIKRKLNKG